MGGQINLDLSDYEGLKRDVEAARAETATVQRELEIERARPTDERLAQAYLVIDAAKPVIDYAIGNLSPEFSRRWPFEDLRTLAANIASVGHVTDRDKERALLWTEYVAQIIEHDRRWALGQNADARVNEILKDVPKGPTKEDFLAAVEASVSAMTPQTDPRTPWWAWAIVAMAIAGVLIAVTGAILF